MLGEDDWFDKMAGIGRDHLRFAHMRHLQAFTNQQKALILRERAGILGESAGILQEAAASVTAGAG
jgi:hypothetical protein